MKRPGDGGEPVEFVETLDIPSADVQVEVTGPGQVTMTVDADGSEFEFAILLTSDKARELGDLLYRKGCDAASAESPT